ncbi:MAG: hypothetical protein ACK4PR_14430, partial [Gammaproteobacteria bacterium]
MSLTQLMQLLNKIENAEPKKQVEKEIDMSILDDYKKTLEQIAARHQVLVIPLTQQQAKEHQQANQITLDIVPQPAPDNTVQPNNILTNAAPAPILSFAFKTRDQLSEVELTQLERNGFMLESAFESFKKEIGGAGISTNNFTAVMRNGSLPINMPKAMHPSAFIERMFNDLLLKNPGNAKESSVRQQVAAHTGIAKEPNLSDYKHEEPKTFHPTPFSMTP